jgi:hypothetical protein
MFFNSLFYIRYLILFIHFFYFCILNFCVPKGTLRMLGTSYCHVGFISVKLVYVEKMVTRSQMIYWERIKF